MVRELEQKLVERGVAKAEDFTESTATAEDIEKFEKEFGVQCPEILTEYLSAHSFAFQTIAAAVPDDTDYDSLTGEDGYYELMWMDLLSVPAEQPLRNLIERMEGFRESAAEHQLTFDKAKNFIVIGDWMAGAGPLCIDLSRPDEEVNLEDEDTWNIRFFDHEESDWEEYYMEDGVLSPTAVAPDFKTLLEWYFGGKFDENYLEQCDEDGEEPEPFSNWIEY